MKRKTFLDMGSSTSSSLRRKTEGESPDEGDCDYDYDVFISFRGEDTRTNFTSHVDVALRRKQIKAFIDSEDLRTGHEISGSLLKAIQSSKLYLVIFSPNYGSSRWCLQELEKILECSKQRGRLIIPVFYKIDPSHVRHQSGNFSDAFINHEAREEEHKVQRWRTTLRKAASLSGLHLNEHKLESKFIDEIVEAILKELPLRTPSIFLVGVDPHIKKVLSLLCMDSPEVCSVGIWGMGGIGKTTIAEAVFCSIRTQFDEYYFFKNVQEELKQLGEDAFWNKLLSQILDDKNLLTPSLRLSSVKQRLQRKRVFIVFDDVDDSVFLQLQDLVEHHDLFAVGSKILMTSRDRHVLQKLLADEVYQVVGLQYEGALKLFSLKAFRKESPPAGFIEFSKQVVRYTQGNPLALTVLGSALLNRSKAYWDSALEKVNFFPKQSILDLLRISYDGLSHEERDIFLDIACFFKDEDGYHVEKLLGCFYDCVHSIIINLIDKSLISVSQENKLELHDLLQEMAWKITDEEDFTNDPGKRKRLHNSKDIYQVLTEKKGTEAIQGMTLNLSEVKTINFGFDAFSLMVNLRWLKVYGQNAEVCLLSAQRMINFRWFEIFRKNDEVFLPHMKYLSWEAFPLKSLSSTFNIHNLVKLSLRRSKVERLWRGVQDVVNLRWMDLSDSPNLTEIPDLSKAKNIECMVLENCDNLTMLHPSVQYLNKLEVLNLYYCFNLREIPGTLESKVLRVFSLLACKKVKECPKICGDKLERLSLTASEMKEVPDCIGFQFLTSLWLHGCSKLTKFCEIPRTLESLYLVETGIEEVPSSLQFLTRLTYLWFGHNQKLRSISNSISALESLRYLYIVRCQLLRFIPELPLSIVYLQVQDCPSLKTLSPISNQSHLESLGLVNCGKLDDESLRNVMAHVFFKIQLSCKSMRALIPGSEIPEWFPHQSHVGSSVTFQWPSDDLHNNYSFSSFGFCASLEMNPPSVLKIHAHEEIGDDDVGAKINIVLRQSRYKNCRSDHLELQYISPGSYSCERIRQMLSGELCSKLSFQFTPSQPHFVVKKCGVYVSLV